MRKIWTYLLIILLTYSCSTNTKKPSKKINNAWTEWRNGNIEIAQNLIKETLRSNVNIDTIYHLSLLVNAVKGDYQSAIRSFNKIDTSYIKYKSTVKFVADIYEHHLLNLDKTFKLLKSIDHPDTTFILTRISRPFICEAENTKIIPFNNEVKNAKYFPAINGKINNKEIVLRLDTGAPYLIMNKEHAIELGIELQKSGIAMHGPNKVKSWKGIVNKLELGDGIILRNVPVVVLPTVNNIIIGTNILKCFYTTIDYPNSRFILTPRTKKDLIENHKKILNSKKTVTVPFYLWSDHYMFTKGSLDEKDSLNFFVDSGLLAFYDDGSSIQQSPFTASKRSLIEWGYDENDLQESRFFFTDSKLSLGNITQDSTVVWFNKNKQDKSSFGGVRIDGLISHAFLSKYSWTIDFDNFEYIFGINE